MSVETGPAWMLPMIEEAARYGRPLPEPSPEKTALLCIDCQNFFLHPEGASFLPRSSEMAPRLAVVIERFRSLGSPVYFTAHGHRDPRTDAGMLHEWWGSAIREGSWEAEIFQAVAPVDGEAVIPKRRYSAFVGTDLAERLKGAGVQTVVVAGVMTNLCCETTARDAFCRDYRVVFLADGTATADDSFHGATLLNLAFGFAHVVTCADLLAWLPGER